MTTSPSEIGVGDTALLPLRLVSGTLQVKVVVIDKRTVYGRQEWYVTPIDGEGQAWVTDDTLKGGGTPVVSPSMTRSE